MMDINWLEEIFLNPSDLWGWFGPLALVAIGYVVTMKYKGLGIFFIIVESLVAFTYLDLVTVTPWYWWNIYIMIFGVLSCMIAMIYK